MKTLYCLGGSPQFRLPCLKYGFLLKEKENKDNIFLPKSDLIIKDFYNIEENKKEALVDQWIDKIYPTRSIKKCLQINPTIQLKMKTFYKQLRDSLKSLSIGKNKTIKTINRNNNFEENSKSINLDSVDKENKIKNLKLIINRNNYKNNYIGSINSDSNSSTKFNITNYNFRKEESIKVQNSINPNRTTQKNIKNDLSQKLFNYYYPISNGSSSLDILQSLISKPKAKRKSIFNNKILKNTIEISKYDLKNKKNFSSQVNNTINAKVSRKNNKQIKLKNFKNSNSINNIIYKRKIRRYINQHNNLNILYSENEEQFYKKYDKHVKNKFLNGLCLTHVNSSPKIIINDINAKINKIKNKVGVVKSIVDKTFPKLLADISQIKKEFEKSQGKEGYKSPYIEKISKMQKEQQNIDLYFSKPFEIINQHKSKSNYEKKINKKFNQIHIIK